VQRNPLHHVRVEFRPGQRFFRSSTARKT
jgi:hypothetical protein